MSDSYVSVSYCKIEAKKKSCHSNKQRLKASQGLIPMRGRQVLRRACTSENVHVGVYVLEGVSEGESEGWCEVIWRIC